ncbi:hypothetical protein GCM10017786_64010 [Amycolatopsis deserti]|uniref:Uncharacterized protein n=1 Tax=Amycolatopsis deserti TaxID=185696 RepID=A0ABQ3JDB3_9PSEU|nr:hypothetical protein GCM10017786_64010 [Amycolatopsis deserti]
MHRPVAEVFGAGGQHARLLRAHPPAGQPDPGEGAVGGVVRGEDTRARVGADTSGRGHALTVNGGRSAKYYLDHM